MSKNTISATSGLDDSEVVLVMHKKKFPWWILLLLIPLILLIPIPRQFCIHFSKEVGGQKQDVANNPASVTFPKVSLFGAHEPRSVGKNTDDVGFFDVSDISEPLWHYLFASQDSIDVVCENGCAGVAARFSYQEFVKRKINEVSLKDKKVSTTIIVVNKETGAPLSDATVRITIGGEERTVKTDASGQVSLSDVSACADVSLSASKEGFKDDSMRGSASDIKARPDAERKLRLEPIKPPEPPKKDPPKKEDPPKPPKKEDPPKQDKKEDPPTPPLRGQKGELRINLSWNCKADLDIYITDPCGNQLGPRNLSRTCNGSKGTIDIDANQDATNHPEKARMDPQENAFWSKANPGRYRIQVNCCPLNRKMNLTSTTIPFTIVIEDRGKRTVKQGSITGRYSSGIMDNDVVLKDFWIYEVKE